MGLNNNLRCANRDAVDDEEINNNNMIENVDAGETTDTKKNDDAEVDEIESKDITKNDGENIETEENKNVRVIVDGEEVRSSLSGRPMLENIELK